MIYNKDYLLLNYIEIVHQENSLLSYDILN